MLQYTTLHVTLRFTKHYVYTCNIKYYNTQRLHVTLRITKHYVYTCNIKYTQRLHVTLRITKHYVTWYIMLHVTLSITIHHVTRNITYYKTPRLHVIINKKAGFSVTLLLFLATLKTMFAYKRGDWSSSWHQQYKLTIELLSFFSPWFQISKFEIPCKDLMK